MNMKTSEKIFPYTVTKRTFPCISPGYIETIYKRKLQLRNLWNLVLWNGPKQTEKCPGLSWDDFNIFVKIWKSVLETFVLVNWLRVVREAMRSACLYSVQIDLCSLELSSPLCDYFLRMVVRLFDFSIEIYSKLFLGSPMSSSVQCLAAFVWNDRSTVFRIFRTIVSSSFHYRTQDSSSDFKCLERVTDHAAHHYTVTYSLMSRPSYSIALFYSAPQSRTPS
jgi:hypothetical protein